MSNPRKGKSFQLPFSAEFALLLYYAAVALSFTFLRFQRTFQFEEAASADALVAGSAHLPFQYRALVPWTVRLLSAAIPGPASSEEIYALFAAIDALTLFGMLILFRRYLAFVTGADRSSGFLTLMLPLALSACVFGYTEYPYWYPSDLPAALFTVLALLALTLRRIGAFYLIFVAATLNRETSIFLAFLYAAIYSGRMPVRQLALNGTFLVLLWLGAKGALFLAYGSNPGYGLYQIKLWHNLVNIANPRVYPLLLSTAGFLIIPALAVRSRIASLEVRRSLLVVYPFLFGLLFVANVYELRVYIDVVPIIVSGWAVFILQEARR